MPPPAVMTESRRSPCSPQTAWPLGSSSRRRWSPARRRTRATPGCTALEVEADPFALAAHFTIELRGYRRAGGSRVRCPCRGPRRGASARSESPSRGRGDFGVVGEGMSTAPVVPDDLAQDREVQRVLLLACRVHTERGGKNRSLPLPPSADRPSHHKEHLTVLSAEPAPKGEASWEAIGVRRWVQAMEATVDA